MIQLEEIRLLETPQEVAQACLTACKQFEERIYPYGLMVTPETAQRWWLRKVETIEGDLRGGD